MAEPARDYPPPGEARAPGRILRALLRMPIRMLDRRGGGSERRIPKEWILLTTKGRKTGRPHRVMLDLVGHDPATSRYYVQPGWGRQSDWVLNVEANPEVEAQVGDDSFSARAIDVSGAEGAEWVMRFSRKHPLRNLLISKLLLRIRVPLTRDEAVIRGWLERHFLVFAIERKP